jgi:ribosomal protein S18 acetylase RimI-like enzyme
MTSQETIAAQSDEADKTISTLVTAFASDPFIRWMFPRADQYIEAFPRVLQYFAGAAFGNQSAYRSVNFGGAALWLPPGVSPDEEGLGQVLVEHVNEDMQEQVFSVMEQVGGGHPEAPHWYLPAMGVDPIYQRSGVGSSVLDHSLRRCNQTCELAYLESTNPANIPFYQRHGFEVVGEIQIDGSPVLTRMLRTAA